MITDLLKCVDRLIGSFHGQVVFLDQHYCFCTWDLEKGAASLKKHLFLPKDWLSPGMLKLCMLNSYGTILCPKKWRGCYYSIWNQAVVFCYLPGS